MGDLNSFAKRIRKIGQRIETNADKEVTKLAGIINQSVTSGTPVDTGRARNNWFATLGVPRLFPDKEEGAYEKTGQVRISENNTIISNRGSGQSVFITNNLPYIKRLNEGHSLQASAGFVEKAVAAAKRAMKGAKLLKR